MICLNRKGYGNMRVAVNPDHIVYLSVGMRFEDDGKAETWTVITLTYSGGPERTELHVTQTIPDIIGEIKTYRKES